MAAWPISSWKMKNTSEEGGLLPVQFCHSLSQRSCLQGWTPISSVQTLPFPSAWRDSCGGTGRDNLIYSSGSGMNSCAAKETPSCVLWKSSLSDTGWQLSESLGRDLILQSINSPHYSTTEKTEARASEFFMADSGLEPSAPPAWFSVPSPKPDPHPIERCIVAPSLPHLFSIVSRLFAAFQALFT